MEHSAFFTSPIGSEPAQEDALTKLELHQVEPHSDGKRRNVFIILPSAMVGGAERVAYNLVTALLADGHKVIVYSMTRGPGPLWPGLTEKPGFTHLASNAPSEKRGILDFLIRSKALRKHGPFDLLYTSHVHVNALASLALRFGLIKARRFVSRESTRIFDRYHGWRSWIYRAAYRCYGKQDLLLFQTEEMRQSLEEAIKLPEGMDLVITPNPVNLDGVDTAISQAPATPRSPNRFRIVFCGRLIPLKRLELLLEALAQLDNKRDWQLDILGDGPMQQDLSILAETLGLTHKVRFHGSVSNPYAYFAQADLGVLCSRIEGFPNVLLEMMASGTKQIISTPCTPAVRDLPDVAILNEATAQNLVALIARVMDHRPDCTEAYRSHVEAKHSIEGFTNTVFGEQVLAPKS